MPFSRFRWLLILGANLLLRTDAAQKFATPCTKRDEDHDSWFHFKTVRILLLNCYAGAER